MTDLLGPASALNSVTTRPSDTRVFGENNTWFKDCSSPTRNDGTYIEASFLNGILAQIRRAIVGMGVPINNADDDMLLKAIQSVALTIDAITRSQARANMPIFPEVLGTTGKVSVSGSAGQVVVGTTEAFVWRGLFRIDLSTFPVADRTFVTAPNKTYHLRWSAPGTGPAVPATDFPNGRLLLRDLDDSNYNPGALAEDDAAFDSAFDDMLIARVETNSSNAPTITTLSNKARLSDIRVLDGTRITGPSGDGTRYAFATKLDWARTPKFLHSVRRIGDPNSGGIRRDEDVESLSVTRYGMSAQMLMDYSTIYSINALFLVN